MSCNRCPHHVRHGQIGADSTVQFKDVCGLVVKQGGKHDDSKGRQRSVKVARSSECIHYPFKEGFDYMMCEIYVETFKSVGRKNDVVPTKDFQYSEAFSGGSIADMELL